MDPAKAKALLQEQIEKSQQIQQKPRFGAEWSAWKRETEVLIEKVFSKDSRNLKDFTEIPYALAVWLSGMPESKDIEAYNQGLETARRYLASMIQELDLYPDSEDTDTNIKVRLRDLFCAFIYLAASFAPAERTAQHLRLRTSMTFRTYFTPYSISIVMIYGRKNGHHPTQVRLLEWISC